MSADHLFENRMGPIVKLSVEDMKMQCITMLNKRDIDIAEAVNQAFEAINIDALVAPIVQKALEDGVRRYFAYGEGAKDINEAIQGSFTKTARQRRRDRKAARDLKGK